VLEFIFPQHLLSFAPVPYFVVGKNLKCQNFDFIIEKLALLFFILLARIYQAVSLCQPEIILFYPMF